MKRWTAVLAVLALALTVCCAAATVAETTLDGTWVMVAFDGGDAPDSYKMAFDSTSGICTITMEYGGQVFSQEFAYTASEDAITVNGEDAAYALDGDMLKITSNGETMTLVREGAEIPDIPISGNDGSLEGTWVMGDFTGTGIEGCSMKFENGVCTMTIVHDGSIMSNEMAYTIDGTVISMNGSEGTAVVDGDTLTITESGDTMTLTRTAAADDGLAGTWVMTDFTQGDYFSSWEMRFEDGICYLTASMGSETQALIVPYRADGNTLVINGSEAAIELDGDTLKITESGDTMTLVRK